MIYVVDTNSFRLLEGYFPKRFPSFWEKLDELVAQGRLISVHEVYNELDSRLPKDEHVREWIKANKGIFVKPSGKEGGFVSDIFSVRHFQTLVSRTRLLQGGPVADPFLVAAARARCGCVVTEEGVKPNAAKIPNVCEHFNVPCTNVEGMLENENWTF